jgi:4-amino-4-deoxy-L-arabinose transferase-like glycosyltransferase
VLHSRITAESRRPSPAADKSPASANALTPVRVFLCLAIYFALQTALRVAVSDSAELDESGQLLMSQSFSWGYGSDPPLYTWLQMLCFRLFGLNILALALLKNTAIFLCFWFTYLGAREVAGSRTGCVACLSLLFFPDVAWEFQRDLTHSILATALAAATFWIAVRLWKRGDIADYLYLGLCLGLGALSKYSYCLVVVSLGIASAAIPELRRALLNRRIILSLVAMLLVLGWHIHWTFFRPDLALSRLHEVVPPTGASFVRSRLVAIWSVPQCAILLGAALCACYWLAFRPLRLSSPDPASRTMQRWIWRTFGVCFALAAVVAVGTGIEMVPRWFEPIIFLGAISAALAVQQRLNDRTLKRFLVLVGTVAGSVLVILPGIPLAAALTHRPTRLNAPYSALCQELKLVVGHPKLILASSRLVGGNLRLSFRDCPVLAPEFALVPVKANSPALLVWDTAKSANPDPALVRLTHQFLGKDIRDRTPQFVEAPLQYAPARRMRLGYFLVR